jgi:hypothetical protein
MVERIGQKNVRGYISYEMDYSNKEQRIYIYILKDGIQQ